MKKVITFLLIFFIGIIGVSAKDFNSFACDYNLTYSSQGDNGITNMFDYGKVQIQVNNYNSDDPKVTIYYTNKNGKLVEYDGPTYDYQGENDTGMLMRFFTTNKKKEFVNNFKNNSQTCPELYTNFLSSINSVDVELHPVEPDLTGTYWANSSNKLLLYDEATGEWKNKDDFYKDDNVEVKEPRVCEYTMQFDLFPQKVAIKLVTNYEVGTNKESYEFIINGNKASFSDLNSEQAVSMGTGTGALVRVSADQLKKLYSGNECPAKNELFSYLDGNGVYNVTTDEDEAKDNGMAGRYDEAGDAFPTTSGNSNLGAGLKPPTQVGFGEGGDSCSEVLGSTLTALVKEAVKWVRIAGAIIAIVNGMLKLIPAIMSKDAEALNKAFRTCIIMAIVLVFCVLFDWLLGLIGSIFKWDVSCII